VIYHAARAYDISLVVFWMNACFHLSIGARIYACRPIFASDETA
jgi:hypothetical protein